MTRKFSFLSKGTEVDKLVVPTEIKYEYPKIKDIKDNLIVKKAMDDAWAETKRLCTAEGRHEVGFYIYYDFTTNTFCIGELVIGPLVTGCDGTAANVNLGVPTNGINVCAFFHTHTPLTYCPSDVSRPTGPSLADILFAKTNGLPGLLYDYSAPEISGRDSKDKMAKVYTFGPSRRTSLSIN